MRDKLNFVSLSIQIRAEVLASLTRHAQRDPRTECCGLLAGRAATITHAFPAENVASNPATNYEIATREIVHLTRTIREASLELLGIYHSHPNLNGQPSETDVALASYPDVAYFIISPVTNAASPVRAFSICDGRTVELKVVQV